MGRPWSFAGSARRICCHVLAPVRYAAEAALATARTVRLPLPDHEVLRAGGRATQVVGCADDKPRGRKRLLLRTLICDMTPRQRVTMATRRVIGVGLRTLARDPSSPAARSLNTLM